MNSALNHFWQALEDHHSAHHRLVLVGIILLGLLLRLYSLQVGQAYTYFAINDEVTALQYALGLLAGDTHMYYLGSPALNQGNIPGPLWSLLVAFLYILGGSSAEGAVFGMLVLNTLSIYIVYRLAIAFMSARYALISSLLFSSSPWVIYYAAGLYNPIPLAILGAFLYLNLWYVTQRHNSKGIFWVCLIAAAIPQFHMIGIFYLPAILLLLFLSPVKINLRWFIFGAIAGMVLYLPYLIGDYLNDWQNTQAILQGEKSFSLGILKIITIPIAMLANHPGQWAGPDFNDFKIYANQYFGSYIVLIVINLVAIILSATFIFSLLRKSFRYLKQENFRLKTCYAKHSVVMFTVLLLFLPLILYTLTGRGYTTRYSIMIFPLLFLLPAMFMARLPLGRLKSMISYGLVIIFCTNIYMLLSFYYDQRKRIQASNLLMPSFSQLEKMKEHIDSKIKPGTPLEFTYSAAIQNLPEGQRKLYITVDDFLTAYRKTEGLKTNINTVKLHVMRAHEVDTQYPTKDVIYTSPAIRIVNVPSVQ